MYLNVRQKYKEQEFLSADNSVNLDTITFSSKVKNGTRLGQ